MDIQNCGTVGVQINSASVTAENLKTSGNAWGGINLDVGSGQTAAPAVEITGEGTNLQEANAIYSDCETVSASITAPGFTGVKINGDSAEIRYTTDVPALVTALNAAAGGSSLSVEDFVADVDGVWYTDFAAALNAVEENSTITLLADVKTNAPISLPAGVTLNGNGHKITYTGKRTDNSKPNNGAFITANKDADNVTIKNVTIDAGENIKHGVQFYCNDKGALSGVTINGAAWTSVMVNGATNVTIENCDLNPNSATGYANIEYGLGENVTEIPSVTVNNVTVDSSKPAIWVDDETIAKIKTGEIDTDDEVKEAITKNIKNEGSSNISVTFEWTAGNTDTTTVPGTNQSHGGSSGSSGYAITVPSDIKNGDVTVSPSRATAGTVVTITVKPDSGYELDSLTVTDKNGKTVALKDIGNNKYTFTMPSGAVKIAAEFVEETPVSTLPFDDVAATAWYYDAVEYVYDNGLMNGTASDTFAPNATLTRGMLATVLWRMEGSPVVNYALPFEDVSGDQWYTEAIRWAASVGVVNGTSATTYAPNANITREQLATMLYRYAAYKSGSVSTSASLSGFTDAGSVSDYAADAMEWAVAEEIIGGMTSTTLVPQGSATRAQTATMLMRYCENVL